MQSSAKSGSLIRFGVFELDLCNRELRKKGVKVKLQQQPFDLLQVLLERRPDAVTREEIRERLWPAGVHVDFDRSLNKAVVKLREALGDGAESPRFVETLPRYGYRFIAPVATDPGPPGPVEEPTPAVRQTSPPAPDSNARWFAFWPRPAPLPLIASIGLTVALIGLTWYNWPAAFSPREQPLRIESLAVLPLDNLSGDPAQEYFADGITDELITMLAKIHGLRVISRTSVMGYRKTHLRIPEIARELHVDAIVEGTVLHSGDRVRITAQLIHGASDRHLWAEEYERDLRDVLTLQGDVARAIAGQVELRLPPGERGQPVHSRSVEAASQPPPHPVDRQAYDLTLQGRYAQSQLTEERIRKSMVYFEEAAAHDPNYAPAYTGMADSYSYLGIMEMAAPGEVLPKAKAAALKAIQLDSREPGAYTSLGIVESLYEWDWAGAERQFLRAVELNPGFAYGRHWHAHFYEMMGRWTEALAEMRKALDLDPLNPMFGEDVSYDLYCNRRYDEAIPLLNKILRIDAEDPFAHVIIALALEAKGKRAEALAELERGQPYFGGLSSAAGTAAGIYCRSGKPEEARKILARVDVLAKKQYVSPLTGVLIHLALGEKAEGLRLLDLACRERSPNVALNLADPAFDSVRQDPRFLHIIAQTGLPKAAWAPSPIAR